MANYTAEDLHEIEVSFVTAISVFDELLEYSFDDFANADPEWQSTMMNHLKDAFDSYLQFEDTVRRTEGLRDKFKKLVPHYMFSYLMLSNDMCFDVSQVIEWLIQINLFDDPCNFHTPWETLLGKNIRCLEEAFIRRGIVGSHSLSLTFII